MDPHDSDFQRLLRENRMLRAELDACRAELAAQDTGRAGGKESPEPEDEADARLRDIEHRLGFFEEHMTDVVWTLDTATGFFTYVSPSVERLRGYTAEEVMAESMTDALMPDVARTLGDMLPELVRRFLVGESLAEVRMPRLLEQPCKDGSTVWTEVHTSFARNEASGNVEVLGVSRDVSATVRAEAALSQSETAFETMFDSSPTATILTTTPGGIIVKVNDRFLAGTGYGPEDVLGRCAYDLGILVDAEEAARMFAEARTRGAVVNRDFRIRTKDGRIIRCLLSAVHIIAGGEPCMLTTVVNIDEMKRAEDALRMSEEQFRTLAENMSEGLMRVDELGVIEYVNPALCRLLGFEEQELLGFNVLETLVFPEDRDHVQRRISERLEGKTSRYTSRLRKKDDGAVMVEINGAPASFLHSIRKGSIAIISDVSERMAREKALRESERAFSATFQDSPVSMSISLLEDGSLLEVNERFLLDSGYTRSELLGRSAVELGLFSAPGEHEQLIADVRRNGQVYGREMQLRSKSGKTHVHLVSATLIERANRACLLSSMIDISEWKRTEQALWASEEKFSHFFNLNPLPSTITTIDGTVLDTNEAFHAATGLSREDVLGSSSVDMHMYDEPGARERIIESLKNYGTVSNVRLTFRMPSGRTIPSVSSFRMITIKGSPVILGVHTDITAQQAAEESLRQAKDRAEASDRMKDLFVANISHEVRTPLNIILGYNKVISEKFLPVSPPSDRRFFDAVQRGGDRLMRTVDAILNISRLEAGAFTLHPVRLDLCGIVRKIASDHQTLAHAKSLSLIVAEDCSGAHVVADEYCVTQAVSNLVHNAIKFTRQGDVELRVFSNADGRFCISCRDTGIGIARDYIPHLFTRYTQEQDGYTRPFEGLGLGMALVKEYLTRSGATIAVDSTKGKGTTFTITFHPDAATAAAAERAAEAARAAETDAEIAADASPAEAVSAPGRPDGARGAAEMHHGSSAGRVDAAIHADAPHAKPTVLLVEDDELSVEFLGMVLGDGYTILNASSADAAWTLLRAQPVDIILMDISIRGGKTGLDLTREIRRSTKHAAIPIIAVTAHAYATDRATSMEAGCSEYISKPLNVSRLLESMRALLQAP